MWREERDCGGEKTHDGDWRSEGLHVERGQQLHADEQRTTTLTKKSKKHPTMNLGTSKLPYATYLARVNGCAFISDIKKCMKL